MTCVFKQCITFLITLLMTIVPASSDVGQEVYHIPRIEGLIVDGSADDWGTMGFRVEILADPDGRTLPVDDFDAKFRLAWDQQGLYVLAVVRDDISVEHENLSRLWRTDCVELFISEFVGSTNRYQIVIASGADPEYESARQRIYDWRHPNYKTSELTALSASQVSKGGYVIEALLPWANLGLKPDTSTEIGFQFVANDDDGNTGDSNGSLRVSWFRGIGPTNRFNMHRLRLSNESSKPVFYRVDRKINLGRCAISILGSSEWIGKQVALRSEEGILNRGALQQKNGRAYRELNLDSGKYPDEWPQLDIVVEDKIVAAFDALSTLDRILERYIQALGGRQAIERLKTRECNGKFVDDLSWTDPQVQAYPLKAFAKIPDKWITTLQISKGTEQNGFDGSIGWKQNPDRIERDDRMRRSWLGFVLNPHGPLLIQEYFPEMTLEKKDVFSGRTVYVVETSGTQNMLYFDAETGLLNWIGSSWELQNYREADGVKFPFRIATSRKGGESYFAFDKIEHNVPIDDKEFAIPDAGDVFAGAFEDIEDSKALPMLKMKTLSYEHGEMNIPCRDGRFLYDLIICNGYKRGLEIGTFNGYSTLWLGLAFRKTGGHVITIEYDQVSAEEAQRNFIKAGLEDVIDSRTNDAFEEIPKIEGNFDFVFIDAWKPDYVKFLRLLRDRISPGGAIVAHNVTNQAGDMQEFLEAIRNDPSLETTFHEISAEGFSVSIKRK